MRRRSFLAASGAALLAARLPARAQTPERHGLSSFGDLKYPAGFPRFDYVEPLAPKGGTFSAQLSTTTGNQAFETFNTLNIYVLKGDGAAGMDLTFDSLMVRALDEPDAVYGLVARSVSVSDDGLAYRFSLRPQARFHDGSRLTARDVAFSIMTLKEKGHPQIAAVLRDVAGASPDGDDAVVVRFAPGRSRDLPLIVADLPIFSEAYYRGRDFEASTLEPPLGSGAYRVARFEVGRFIAFERVADYWGADLPVSIGQNNFGEIRYEYFRDRDVAFEAFKAGTFTWREEFTSRVWATGYDFPAAQEGRVKRETVPDHTPSGTQGWFLNTRRAVFRDSRIREAIGLAFDFEWSNQNLMYGAYRRTASFFENSDLKAEGMPSPEELALLEPFRGKVPDEVFGEPVSPPRSDGSGQDRALLRRADTLLRQAGCTRDGGVMKLPDGQPLAFEFLDSSPVFQPLLQSYIKNLSLIGIRASSRLVDAAQYQARLKDFDFDVVSTRFGGSVTPGAGLREVYGSRAAKVPGSQNLAGIENPAADAMLDRIADAASRADLTTACRALDRCCAPAATGCRCGTAPSTASRSGTCTAARATCPNTASAPPPCGGTMPTRPERSDGPDLMAAYLIRRLLLMIPTILGIMLISFTIVQFAPGGPVERVLAQLQGQNTAMSRITGGGGDLAGRGGTSQAGEGNRIPATAARKGSIPPSSSAWSSNSASTSRPRALREDAVGLCPLRLRKKLFSRCLGAPAHPREAAGLDQLRPVDDADLLRDLDSARHPQGGARRLALRRLDLRRRHRRLRDSRLPVRDPADRAVCRRLVLADLPVARADQRGLVAFSLWHKVTDYLWHITLPIIAMAIGAFATSTLLTKNSFLDEIRKQYVLTARMKGLSERQVLYGHVFRNAMLIVVAGFPGAFISAFFAGSLLIETIFSLDGLGLLSFESIVNRDYPVVFANLYIFSLLGLVVNLISDLTYSWIDPRIDFEARAA